ncbi:hypothetical protein K5549_005074 [Capra hircus]|nr:hypothetical protein K5549_005074 [Capra hircus]
MSESSSKSSQPLASKQEKDGAEKRGRGRPRKQPPKEPSEVPTPKRPRGRPKGSKNKGATKTRDTTHILLSHSSPAGLGWACWGGSPGPPLPTVPHHLGHWSLGGHRRGHF